MRHLQGCFTWRRACEIWESFWAFLFSGGSVMGLGYWFYARSFSLMYGFTIPLEIRLYEKTNAEKSEWKEIIWFRGLFLHLHIQMFNFPGQGGCGFMAFSSYCDPVMKKANLFFRQSHIYISLRDCEGIVIFRNHVNPSKTHTQLSNDPHQPCTLSHILSRIDLSCKTICEAVCAMCKHRHALKRTCKHTHTQLQGFLRDTLESARKVCETFSGKTRLKPSNYNFLRPPRHFRLPSTFPPSVSPRVDALECLLFSRCFLPQAKLNIVNTFPVVPLAKKPIITADPHPNTHADTKNVNACSHAYVRTLTHIQDDFFSFNERGKVKDKHTLHLYLLWLPAHLLFAKDKELCSQQIQ